MRYAERREGERRGYAAKGRCKCIYVGRGGEGIPLDPTVIN